MSRSERRAIAAISMCKGVNLNLRRHYQDLPGRREIKRKIEKLSEACEAAFLEFQGQLNARDVQKLQIKLEKVETECFGEVDGQEQCVVTMLSLCQGIVSDIYDQTRHSMRRAVLDGLLGVLWSMHKYFDRGLNRWTAYETATRGIAVWEQEMAA